jgi:hypothetical protein
MIVRPPIQTYPGEGIDIDWRDIPEISIDEMNRFLHGETLTVRLVEDVPHFYFWIYAFETKADRSEWRTARCKVRFDNASQILGEGRAIFDLMAMKHSIDNKLATLLVEHVYNLQSSIPCIKDDGRG